MRGTALFLMLFFAQAACATSILDRSLEDLYSASDLIVTASVEEISGKCRGEGQCWGYMIRFSPRSIIKDTKLENSESSVSSVCSDVPLEPGRVYTVFLENAERNPVGQIGPCTLALPFDGAFQERAGDMYRMNSPEGLVNVKFAGDIFWTNAIVVPDFQETLASLLGKNW